MHGLAGGQQDRGVGVAQVVQPDHRQLADAERLAGPGELAVEAAAEPLQNAVMVPDLGFIELTVPKTVPLEQRPCIARSAFGMRRAGLGPTGAGMIFGLWTWSSSS
jgi:hypothetical protein